MFQTFQPALQLGQFRCQALLLTFFLALAGHKALLALATGLKPFALLGHCSTGLNNRGCQRFATGRQLGVLGRSLEHFAMARAGVAHHAGRLKHEAIKRNQADAWLLLAPDQAGGRQIFDQPMILNHGHDRRIISAIEAVSQRRNQASAIQNDRLGDEGLLRNEARRARPAFNL